MQHRYDRGEAWGVQEIGADNNGPVPPYEENSMRCAMRLVCIQMLNLVSGSHTVAGIMPRGRRCPRYWWDSPG